MALVAPEVGVPGMYLLKHDGALGKVTYKLLKVCAWFHPAWQGLKTDDIWEYKSAVFSEAFEMRKLKWAFKIFVGRSANEEKKRGHTRGRSL